jgi:hypothetical protein
MVRVTYYTPYEDRWGWLNACPNTKRSTEGVTVAACPTHPFGRRVFIPELAGRLQTGYKIGDGDGLFIVQDRGSAVTSRKAGKYKHPVVDVFVTTNARRDQLSKTMPEYMMAYIDQGEARR